MCKQRLEHLMWVGDGIQEFWHGTVDMHPVRGIIGGCVCLYPVRGG